MIFHCYGVQKKHLNPMACTNTIEREDLSKVKRIVTGFEGVQLFIRKNKGYPCRMTCAVCRDAWARTKTVQINLLYALNKQFFICDTCTTDDDISNGESPVEVRKYKQP